MSKKSQFDAPKRSRPIEDYTGENDRRVGDPDPRAIGEREERRLNRPEPFHYSGPERRTGEPDMRPKGERINRRASTSFKSNQTSVDPNQPLTSVGPGGTETFGHGRPTGSPGNVFVEAALGVLREYEAQLTGAATDERKKYVGARIRTCEVIADRLAMAGNKDKALQIVKKVRDTVDQDPDAILGDGDQVPTRNPDGSPIHPDITGRTPTERYRGRGRAYPDRTADRDVARDAGTRAPSTSQYPSASSAPYDRLTVDECIDATAVIKAAIAKM